MLARLLRFAIFSSVIVTGAWLGLMWRSSPLLALTGVFGVVFLFALILAFQFLVMRQINRGDPVPHASMKNLFRALWAETLLVFQIFFWRQPFFWNSIPDATEDLLDQRGRRGVVFIHGFICNRGLWTPWLRDLKNRRHSFAAVNLEPVFGSIDHYAPTIDEAVSRLTITTGLPPLIVCHSMGGLAVRAWLRSAPGNDARVHHIITIGTPHQGTWLGRFASSLNGHQMQLGSRWLQQMQADEPPERYKLFTCFFSNCDNIVFPASTATLPGANNRLIMGAAHVELAFDQAVMNESLTNI